MTLYREITDEEYEAVISDTGDAQSKYQRMWVVPVEPDYEAAEEAFSERSTDSRSIVDAALGVGEETNDE